MSEKKSTGPNARPKNETIAQTGEGLPDDSGRIPGDVMNADERAARESLDTLGKSAQRDEKPAPSERHAESTSKPERSEG